MTTVTGYLLTGDTGGAGPTVGDTFAPGSSLSFEANDHPILYSGTITYASVGDVHGMFFDVGGSWYFVPMTYFGGQPGDTGTVTEVHDPVQGTAGDEALTAPDGDGYVIYSGADTSGIGSGSDTLTGGSGSDVLIFGDGDDTVYGGDGLDWIDDDGGLQLVGDNYLDGGGGMDFIYAGYGDDTILGGTGADYIYAEADSDTIVFANGFGNDTVWGGETVGAGVDWDALDFSAVTTGLTVALNGIGYGTVTDGASTVRFYEIEEIVTGSGDDFITAGADTVGLSFSTGTGNDTIWGGLGNDTAYGGDGADEIYLDAGNDLVYGEAGDDDLGGDAGDDTIYGGDGADWIQGNQGADLLDGGAGNDTFEVFTTQAGSDTITGGETGELSGDVIRFTGADAVSVLFTANETGTFSAGVASGSFSEIEQWVGGTGTTDVIDATGATTGVTAFNITRFETIWGSAHDDRFYWMNATSAVTAALGDGNDSVQAGSGADTIWGGDGNDTIWAGFGNDTVGGDAGDDYLYGGYGNDTLYGGVGDDTIGVGRNSDTAYGEDGSDTFFFEHDMGTNTVFGGNGGSDIDRLDFDMLALAPVTVTWTTNEGGTATDPYGSVTFWEMEGAIGSDFNDTISAAAATTTKWLDGGAGNDSITGGSGGDYITGGDGNDTVWSGNGADTILGGTGDDLLSGEADADTFLVFDDFGNDTIAGGNTVSTGTNVDTIDLRGVTADLTVTFTGDGAGTITDGTDTITFTGIERIYLGEGADVFDSTADGSGIEVHGWDGADTITTGDGADHIAAGDGADAIRSGGGSDTIWGDAGSDTVTVVDDDTGSDTIYAGDEGGDIDAFVFENSATTGGVDVTFAGWETGSYTFGTATGTFYEIEQVTATEYTDTLDASASGAGHALDGLGGDDTIAGGSGADTISGGDGNDRLDGNAGADVLTGGDGDDLLDGGLGDDTVTGDAGDDTYVLTDSFGTDSFTAGETGEALGDTVDASAITAGAVTVAWTDAATGVLTVNTNTLTFSEVETYTLTQYDDTFDATLSGAAVEVDGGAGDDSLTGSALADTLTGGVGDDQFWGGAGADLLSGGDGDDGFHLADGFGDATVSGGETGEVLGDTLHATGMTSDLTVTFTGDDAGTISDGTATVSFTGIERVLTGEGSDRVDLSGDTDGVYLFTDDGDDTVVSGRGDDTINTGNNGDTIYVSDASGTDTISAGNATDTIHFTDLSGLGVVVDYSSAGTGTYLFNALTADGSFSSVENLYGTAYTDTFMADAVAAGQAVDIRAGDGADWYDAGLADDSFFGEGGDDTFYVVALGGTDDFHGGETSETLGDWLIASDVTADLTVIYADGEDGALTDGTHALAFSETEYVVLGSGNDSVDGSAAIEDIWLDAGDGDDTITGGTGADILDGGAGADTIEAGAGDDTLTGGDGDDLFVFGDGDGADTITDFDLADDDLDGFTNDQLDLANLTDSGGNPVNVWDVVVSDTAGDGSGDAILIFPNGESLTLAGLDPAALDAAMMQAMGIPCLVAGTLVDTPDGGRRVEDLAPGDLVTTRGGEAMPVIWSASRRLDAAALAAEPRLRPVRIRAGALGNWRDLLVSPQHRIALERDGGPAGFVPARWLAEAGGGAFRIARGLRTVTYVHLLLPDHALIRAEGAWVESFYPGPQGLAAIDPVARADLFGLVPALAGIRTRADARKAYGPLALKEIRRRDLPRYLDTPAPAPSAQRRRKPGRGNAAPSTAALTVPDPRQPRRRPGARPGPAAPRAPA